MLLTGDHLRALDALSASEAGGQAAPAVAEDQNDVYFVLQLQGLARPRNGRSYILTPDGREAVQLLGEMRARGLLAPTDQIDPAWRFLGSDVVAALAAAGRAGDRVGPLGAELLRTRGLAQTSRDPERKTSSLRLNAYGTAWLTLVQRTRPHLEVTGDLANSVHRMPPTYADPHELDIPPGHRAQLEAMRLLVWSVPDRAVFTFTALGTAVYEALRQGGYPIADIVLDDAIMTLLATLADKGGGSLPPEQLAQVQMLGYAGPDGSLTPAGEAAVRARQLLDAQPARRPATIAIGREEAEVLHVVGQLSTGTDAGAQAPTKPALRHAQVGRLERRYQELAGKYGRTIEEIPERKREVQRMVTALRDRDRTFGAPDVLDEWLVHLESFELVRGEGEGKHTVYRLTPHGRRVVQEQGDTPRAVSGTAVKAITITTMAGYDYAPTAPWMARARAEGLIGPGGITKAGHFYAWLAEHARRWPALTRQEAKVLLDLPADEALDRTRGDRPAGRAGAENQDEDEPARTLDRLEARGLIERLVDGQLQRTESGRVLMRAVAGALELDHPVTPAIVRLLAAVREVGESLYVKEPKVRIQPHQWAEVERLTGLGPDEFQETVRLARLGKYLGEANLTEAGTDVLEALDAGNREA